MPDINTDSISQAPRPATKKKYAPKSTTKPYKISDEEIDLVVRFYNPLAANRKIIEDIKKSGFPSMHWKRYAQIIDDPRFKERYNQTIRQYGKGNIATVVDVQRKITSIMENPEATAMEQLKAAELMGRMLGAFNDKLKLEGQLSVVAGVITGVPQRKDSSAEPQQQPYDIKAETVHQDSNYQSDND